MKNELLINVLGWLGSMAVLLAYGLISARKLRGDSWFYQGLNLVGSVFLIINTLHYRALPSAFVNLVWSLIALLALFNLGRGLRRKNG